MYKPFIIRCEKILLKFTNGSKQTIVLIGKIVNKKISSFLFCLPTKSNLFKNIFLSLSVILNYKLTNNKNKTCISSEAHKYKVRRTAKQIEEKEV